MSLSGDKEVAQFKKSVKMGHPNSEYIYINDDNVDHLSVKELQTIYITQDYSL